MTRRALAFRGRLRGRPVFARRASAVVSLILSAGCAAHGTGDSGPDPSREFERLTGPPGARWTNYPTANSLPWIRACWQTPSLANSFLLARALVELDIAMAFERYARLNIVWDGACTTGPPEDGVIEFFFTQEPGKGGFCGNFSGGNFARFVQIPSFNFVDPAGPNPDDAWIDAFGADAAEMETRSYGLHETLHCLGFDHNEMVPPPAGPPNPACVFRNGASESDVNRPSNEHFGGYNRFESHLSICADDPSRFQTRPFPVDVAALQRSYGRRILGSLVTAQGRCAASVASAAGDTAFVWDCDEFADDQEWEWFPTAGTGGRLRVRSTNLCLHAPNDGTTATVQTCGTSSSEWAFPSVMIRGSGGLCLHLENGDTNGGNVVARRCNSADPNQRWAYFFDGSSVGDTIRFAGDTGKCLWASSATNAQLKVKVCSPNNNFRFNFTSSPAGHIKIGADSSKCVDVLSVTDAEYLDGIGEPDDGAAVQTFPCISNQYNQKWNLTGHVKHLPSGKCLRRTVTNGTLFAGTCLASTAFGSADWDYFPRVVN